MLNCGCDSVTLRRCKVWSINNTRTSNEGDRKTVICANRRNCSILCHFIFLSANHFLVLEYLFLATVTLVPFSSDAYPTLSICFIVKMLLRQKNLSLIYFLSFIWFLTTITMINSNKSPKLCHLDFSLQNIFKISMNITRKIGRAHV